jgi:hypothetical protein
VALGRRPPPLHLVSIPGMRESILEGMATEVSELSSEPLW